ncbi:MAG: sugar phosphate isomerase/epimerase [Gammaproteobacteria bacterium]|nr:MAG: sugar phosphate isomerase/epimerase [Gammaproteobacteria bacterium]UTW42490.1 sugar phosphate isomerase/epimerase [bacterium SCSIO 12844]
MKLAISNIAWKSDDYQYYTLLKRYGFSGLEIAPTRFSEYPYDHIKMALKIKNHLLSDYQLPIISMQSLLFGVKGLALFESESARNRLLSYLKKAIIYAKAMKCPVLVFGNPKQRIQHDKLLDNHIAINFFREIGAYAQQHSVYFCIEANPKVYGTNFINNHKQAKWLVETVSSDGFQMIIDTSTMLINQERPESIIDCLDYVKHIHISMPYLNAFNEKHHLYTQWLNEFLAIVKSNQYQHYLSIEMTHTDKTQIEASLSLLQQYIQDRK